MMKTTIVLPMFGSAVFSEHKIALLCKFMRSLRNQGLDSATVAIWSTGDNFGKLQDAAGIVDGKFISASIGALGDNTPLWHKEQLLNSALLDCNTEYFAWIDPDIIFLNDQWLSAAEEALRTDFKVVQLFEYAIDLDVFGIPQRVDTGVGAANVKGLDIVGKPYPDGAHCGYAWMARTEMLRRLGGFPDYLILGGADYKIAMGMLGRMRDSLPSNLLDEEDPLASALYEWGFKARRIVGTPALGYIPGSIVHLYHGEKANRKYKWRDEVLHNTVAFDPYQDLVMKRFCNRIDLLMLNTASCRYEKLKGIAEDYFKHRDTAAV